MNREKYDTCCLALLGNAVLRNCIIQKAYIDITTAKVASYYGNVFINKEATAILPSISGGNDKEYIRSITGIGCSYYDATDGIPEEYVNQGSVYYRRWLEDENIRRTGNNYSQRPTNPPKGFIYHDVNEGSLTWDGYFWVDERNCIHPTNYTEVILHKTGNTLPDLATLISYVDTLFNEEGAPTKSLYNTNYRGVQFYMYTTRTLYTWNGSGWYVTGATPTYSSDNRPSNPVDYEVIIDSTLRQIAWFHPTSQVWKDALGFKVAPRSGSTLNRPTDVESGFLYWDSSYGPIWWNGTKWVNANGFAPHITYGAGGSRPESPDIGTQYYDTILNKPIWWTGTKWVDATGADV